MAIRNFVLFTFFITRSQISPVPSSRTAATMKSSSVHFTSTVNFIAINGMSNKNATVDTMMICLLFFIIINLTLSPAFYINSVQKNHQVDSCIVIIIIHHSLLFQIILLRVFLKLQFPYQSSYSILLDRFQGYKVDTVPEKVFQPV